MGFFKDLYNSQIIEGFVKDILLKCLHPLGKPVICSSCSAVKWRRSGMDIMTDPAATTTDVEVSTRIERMIGKLFLENGFESEVLAGIRPVAGVEFPTDEEGRLVVDDPQQLVMWSQRNILERMRIVRMVFGPNLNLAWLDLRYALYLGYYSTFRAASWRPRLTLMQWSQRRRSRRTCR